MLIIEKKSKTHTHTHTKKTKTGKQNIFQKQIKRIWREYISFCFLKKKMFILPFLVGFIGKADQSWSSQLCISKYKNSSSSQLSAKTPDCVTSDTKMFVGFKFLINSRWLKPIPRVRISRNNSLIKTWSTNSPWPCFVLFKSNQFSENELFQWKREKVEYVERNQLIGT